jgi:hypothetical protein
LFDKAQALLLDPATILDYLVPPGRLRYLVPHDGLRHVTGLTGLAVVSLAVAWWWRFLWLSLTRYLKLDRFNAASLLLSTQVIGILLTLVLLLQSREFASLIGHSRGRLCHTSSCNPESLRA